MHELPTGPPFRMRSNASCSAAGTQVALLCVPYAALGTCQKGKLLFRFVVHVA